MELRGFFEGAGLRCCQKIRIGLSLITRPVVEQFSFICLFLKLMGVMAVVNTLDDLKYHFGVPQAYGVLLSNISLLFLFAYLGAALITVIRPRVPKLIVKCVLYVLLLLIYATGFFLSNNFGLGFSPTLFVLLAETTGAESAEFIDEVILSSAMLPTLKRVVLYMMLILVFEVSWGYVRKKVAGMCGVLKKGVAVVLVPVLLLGMYSTNIYRRIYNAQSPDHIRFMIPPIDPISSIYSSAVVLRMMGENMDRAVEVNKHVYENVASCTAMKDSLNIVVVIGESYIKWHSALYGYALNTTPNLAAEQRKGTLFVFNDVVSSSNSTSVVMRNVLCCNNSSGGELWYEYPFFPAIFKRAGYNVYFWDNQRDVDKNATYSFTLNSFLYNPDLERIAYTKMNDSSYRYDAEIVDSFVSDVGRLDSGLNLVVFHLMGQHRDFKERFPHDRFSCFTADSIKRKESYVDNSVKGVIADYDNATLYNDYVLGKIIAAFADDNTVLVYFSDHGEEVFDYRNRMGREYTSLNRNLLKYQYDVPFMVWCSDVFKAKNPGTVAAIEHAVDRPFMIDNVCNMLFGIAEIETPFYRDSLDLISPDYKCSERFINGMSYEKIRFSDN